MGMPTHNSDTPHNDISQNSDILFDVTKMSLFWEEEDIDFQQKIYLKYLKCFKSEDFFSRILNKKSNSNIRVYTLDAKSSTFQNSEISQKSDILKNIF